MIFSKPVFVIVILCVASSAWAKKYPVYFGTFTDTTSEGIYISQLDAHTGKLNRPQLAAMVNNPNYLAVSSNAHYLFAASRGDTSSQTGTVCVFAIDAATSRLKLLDQKSSSGSGPCYIATDDTGQCVFTANYGSGSVKSFHVNPNGKLTDGTSIQHSGKSINPDRQKGPHAHCIVPAPAGTFALACDLGLDKVMIYRFDSASASLTTNDPAYATVAAGSGPRHLAFSPDGKTVCVLSEMAGTVTVFDWDGVAGKLHPRQTLSVLPDGEYQKTFTTAEIAYRPDGRFVYATIRGPHSPGANSISVLAVNARTGNLSLVENVPSGGDFPRGMAVDPSGHWLVAGNQKSSTVTVFGIDANTGKLTPTGQTVDVGSPVDVKFVPDP